jgi:hypothetical protein
MPVVARPRRRQTAAILLTAVVVRASDNLRKSSVAFGWVVASIPTVEPLESNVIVEVQVAHQEAGERKRHVIATLAF